MTRFHHHPDIGTADVLTASERVQHSLRMGLPDYTAPTPEHPISLWHSSRVTEFGAPACGLLAELEGL